MNKRGFTLVELVVVIGIFGFLAIIATNFFVSLIQSSNQTQIRNEVRENTSQLLEEISSDIRSSGCVWSTSVNGPATQIDLYANSNCSGTAQVSYVVDAVGNVSKTVSGGGSPTVVSSQKIAVCGNQDCGQDTCSPTGLTTILTDGNNPTKRSIKIQIKARQANSARAREDFCAKAILENTVSPRNVDN